MNLPAVDDALRYQGLYVFDFGEWTALGYTAEEIALLLDHEAYRGGKVYKIVRAAPDGRMELRGVAHTRFQLESGMFFARRDLDEARGDFTALRAAGDDGQAPCRAFVHLTDRGADTPAGRYVTAMIYPAEHEDEVARWLLDLGYAGGDTAEGGPSHVTNYYEEAPTILDRAQLWSRSAIPSRSSEDVLSSVRRAVQR